MSKDSRIHHKSKCETGSGSRSSRSPIIPNKEAYVHVKMMHEAGSSAAWDVDKEKVLLHFVGIFD